MPNGDWPTEVYDLLKNFRRSPFSGHDDPNKVVQETELGSSSVGPSGWSNKHDFSSFIGQQNLLDDPILESVMPHTITTTERRISQDWYAKYVLNSGTAPTTLAITRTARTDSSNTLDSDIMGVEFSGPASATNTSVYIYTKDKITIAATRPNLDWLIDSIRIFRLNTPWTTTNLTTFQVTLQLVKNLTGADTTVDTDVLNLATLSSGDVRLLYCGQEQPFTNGDEWDIRIKIDYVTTGSAATNLKVGIYAPQLHFAYGRDPQPFAPERFGAYAFGGDGSDGNVTIASGTTTLTKDMFYNRLTVDSGATLKPDGFRIWCKEYLLNNGTISVAGNTGGNGGNNSGATPGAGGTFAAAAASGSGALLASVSGSAGLDGAVIGASDGVAGRNAVVSAATARIGVEARGGAGGGRGTNAFVAGATGSDTSAVTLEPAGFRSTAGQSQWGYGTGGNFESFSGPDIAGGGGGGGGSGTAGGGGGGGSGSAGGILWISAPIVAGTGTFTAAGGNGGNGGNSSAAGGGAGGTGGSGGWVIIFSRYNIFAGTTTVAAGSGGSAGTAGGTGQAGSTSRSGVAGETMLVQLDPRQ